jgi:hypothetical protein
VNDASIRRLRRSGGVVIASLGLGILLALAGCGGPSSSGPAASTSGGSPAAGSPGSPSSGDGASAGPSIDGVARLTDAFKAMAAGYRFDSTITVGGQVASRAGGRWLKGRSEFVVEENGAALTYRTVPPRSWVYQGGTGWVELAGKAPGGDPLEPLRHPTAVTVVADRPDALVLQATYPPKALGLTGTTGVVVEIDIAPDGTTTATYAAVTTAGQATSVTTLAPATGLDPITVPSPAS